ncbi:hypothetical protein LZ683_21025 [Comamonas testosteroni]|uniref:hypothetical protein n=1 Tax=Comamonas testosteroni TaxID=285 RepID=UPI0023AA9C29|nr:hypothetical protein [Comamonas testosteroni]WEE76604.1 hypothetical protein LZ683_21025 [Comamonas testosteroni]
MSRIILDGAFIGFNGKDGVSAGPGSDISMKGAKVVENGRFGVHADPTASVDMSQAQVIGNKEGGVVVGSFGDLVNAFPALSGIEEGVIREAAQVVANVDPEHAERALEPTRLYTQLKSIGFADWTQIAIGLGQLYLALRAAG